MRRTGLSGLGAMLLLFSFAVAANGLAGWGDVLPYSALAAAGAAVAWLLGMSGALFHPDRPQRLAVATALRGLAELLEASGAGEDPRGTRHRTTVAVLHADRCLGVAPSADAGRPGSGRDTVFVRLTDLCWALLAGSAGHSGPHSAADPAESTAPRPAAGSAEPTTPPRPPSRPLGPRPECSTAAAEIAAQ
ncbi:hypothetical protein ACIHAA_00345 [Streptomyces sp. NPDC052040]|uniref:hypothetical protein n=1 Tax=Streptomyces sp. NPDC052040 TaxID=3365682 RepID=UPI0037D7FFAD